MRTEERESLTPGPWTWDDAEREFDAINILGPEGQYVAQVGYDGLSTARGSKTDALLIAEAPAMFDLLKKFVRGQQPAGLKPQASAIINRVEGT